MLNTEQINELRKLSKEMTSYSDRIFNSDFPITEKVVIATEFTQLSVIIDAMIELDSNNGAMKES